ncbi:MAG: tryptophan--tRNA ligase, partial [Candidatus Eremiobacteraeota bacterium]|nr:tryptophan--tRNA ligase [Candidatus Eremiobacteraeota bacterium]
PGLDGRKMSKSYGNTIDLADDAATTTIKVRTMVTDPLKIRRHDPGRPEVCPVYALHHIADPALVPMVAEGCRSGALGCVDCKGQLAERLNAYLQPVRERRTELEAIDVDGILADGAQRAREVASATLADVKRAMRV